MYLIVGLGNPGEKYVRTRHNVGRMLVDLIRQKHGLPDWKVNKYAEAQTCTGVIGGRSIELMLPETFMNKSGLSVKYAVEKEGVEPENVIVVYDEVDLPFGEVKMSVNRGDGGHNGTASITQAIKTKNFIRVRVGIRHKGLFGVAKRPHGEKLSQYVLGDFNVREVKGIIEDVGEQVNTAIELILKEGVEKAMQECN